MSPSFEANPIGHHEATVAEVLTLLKLLDLGEQDLGAGRTKPVAEIVARLRTKRVGGSRSSSA